MARTQRADGFAAAVDVNVHAVAFQTLQKISAVDDVVKLFVKQRFAVQPVNHSPVFRRIADENVFERDDFFGIGRNENFPVFVGNAGQLCLWVGECV